MTDAKHKGNSGVSRRTFGKGTAIFGAGLGLTATAAAARGTSGDVIEEVVDVVVLGTGAAGSVAALFAHHGGAKVLMLDKGAMRGGTSAKSGGNYWIANNPAMRAAGLIDEKDDFLRYVVRNSFPESYDPDASFFGASADGYELLSTFYDKGSEMVEDLERMGILHSKMFEFLNHPMVDYRTQYPENKAPAGRGLSPVMPEGESGAGDGLMALLHSAIDKAGIRSMTRASATELIMSGNRVAGVAGNLYDGKAFRIAARKGVVAATGGFAHNPALLRRFHKNPVFGACAAPTSTGDLIELTGRIGVQIGNVGGAWRGPVILQEALQYQATPIDTFGTFADSMIYVDKYGRRAVNERRSYHDRAKAMYQWDPGQTEYPRLFNFVIYDQRAAELFGGIMPFPVLPDDGNYVFSGDTLGDLAASIRSYLDEVGPQIGGVQISDDFAETLRSEIARFNEFAVKGEDLDFGRGNNPLDQYMPPVAPGSDWPANDKPQANMYPISAQGPFYAIILAPGLLDTSGGPVIDSQARIIASDGTPVEGLFGAGNCIASPARDSYWAAGCTLGLAMTFGMIAGQSAATAHVAGEQS